MPKLTRKTDTTISTGWELPQPERPSVDVPALDEDMGELPDDDLMESFNLFTRWSNYLDTVLVEHEIEEEEAETILNQAESLFLIHATEGRGTGIQFARVQMAADEGIQGHRTALRLARARRKRLEAHLRDVQRSASFLSRELTRRTSTSPYDRRKTGY